MACALLVLGVTGAWLVRRAPRIEAATARGSLAEGDWLTSGAERSLDVTFGNRGRMQLTARARARLSRLSLEHVELALEDGTVNVDVKPKSGTAWSIAAGPYRVEVLGTAFQTRWSVETKQLEVQVTRGLVRVVGGSLEEQGIRLRAGDRLELDAVNGRAILSAKEALSAPVPSAASPEPSAPRPPPVADAATNAPQSGPAALAEFRELSRRAQHAEAMSLAEKLGFEAVTQAWGPADLKLLADAARYQRRAAHAELALLALRRRFPKSSEAGTAAFLLGRLAAEQQHDYVGAAKWFARYSHEHPSGPMAAEALGRRVQVLAQAGDADGAKLAAAQYLERFPDGPYAKVARGLALGHTLRVEP
jgi:TolA-binding protein